MTLQRTHLRACGPPYTEDEAGRVAAYRTAADGKERTVRECRDRSCGQWHVQVVTESKGKSAPKKGSRSSSGKLIPPAPGEFTPGVKLLIRRRAGRGDVFDARCESCGVLLGAKGGEFSHRDARGMGGSRNRVTNSAANGTLACGSGALKTGCHGLCEKDDEHMKAMGFRLKNGQDPRTEPIMLHGAGGGGATFWLAEDGLGPDGTGYLYSAPALEGAA